MPAGSLTLSYNDVLSTTIFNWARTLADQITTANAFYYLLKQRGAYKTTSDIGDRKQQPLRYENGVAQPYSGYDILDTTPTDGITSAFFDWRQASVPVSIDGLSERKNSGEARMINLLESKTQQAEDGIVEFFNRSFLRGAGGSSITSAATSPLTGAAFIDPLPLLVKYDPTTSTTIGNINQSTNSWWQNQTLNSTSSSFAGFRKELRRLRNLCSKGSGGEPDLHMCDQGSFELYEQALTTLHQNPSYRTADIPFQNLLFDGRPLTWDEFVVDAQGGSATQSTTSGTWYMLNTKFFEIEVDETRNFTATPFVKPENQDARTSQILWLGAASVSNRRKHGVAGGIDTTITS
jgi:hypothetical protein